MILHNHIKKFFRKKKFWNFKGGIYPLEMKIQSNCIAISHLPLPNRFIVFLKQHIGYQGEICVKKGDHVLRGQPLTVGSGYMMLPVHAPTSGTVEAIAPYPISKKREELCVFLRADGQDRWIKLDPQPNYRSLSRKEIIKRIYNAGIAGLGGAGFPAAAKLSIGLQKRVKTLIINAVECEPYITADDRLIQDYTLEVLEGCRILAWILQANHVLIGIEDNKPQAIQAIRQALGDNNDLQLCVIPTKYPSGSAKQLTKILTGLEVPCNGHSLDIGILMHNVATVWAIKRAIINGEPITERVITLTGKSISNPCNAWSRIGTSLSHLLDHVGFTPSASQILIIGGPMMGFTVTSTEIPTVKMTNCILAPSINEIAPRFEEKPCIRCSACAEVCPIRLLPQQLYWYSKTKDHDSTRVYHIEDCIECGACAYVCPSHIPLVQYYRQEKFELQCIDFQKKRMAESKARFEARQIRLQDDRKKRQLLHNIFNTKNFQTLNHTIDDTNDSRKEIIEKAISRVKARKKMHLSKKIEA
ncbi:electron transport complex subunit RsxC [Candidatus Pantoea carbekii]|uniref:Ion-translocating oxidoreductase complex subunit C n=1 Tax=Candidatus Pantoea carbekii TaxID=1235990 RepID=U3U377_9GAMM|nr:electron transport complex subunit RsxC [Candidatus Pantoea carbekii]AKC32085.1 electron transporter RnfC [Candidatus Pantoea carbekii]BAO00611.1 RnfC protein [Candidatus Pantoea carbekii]